MIAAYLTTLGSFGLIFTLLAHRYFFRTKRGAPGSANSGTYYSRYYKPITLTDSLLRFYLITVFPILVILCGVTGLGMNIGNFLVFAATANHNNTLPVYDAPTQVIYDHGLMHFLSSAFAFKFYLLAPLAVGAFNFLTTLGCVLLDQEQSGPAAAFCIGVAGVFGSLVTEVLMIWTTTTFHNPALSTMWWSFASSGVITWLSILFGRSCASD